MPSQLDERPEKMDGDDMATTHQLGRLIDGAKASNKWSDVDLVNIARKKGYVISKSNVSRYRTENPLLSIKGNVIRALAETLGLSVSQVATAAVESMGISLPEYESPTPELAIRMDVDLSERDKQAVLALLRQLRADSPAPARASGEAPKVEKTDGSAAAADDPSAGADLDDEYDDDDIEDTGTE